MLLKHSYFLIQCLIYRYFLNLNFIFLALNIFILISVLNKISKGYGACNSIGYHSNITNVAAFLNIKNLVSTFPLNKCDSVKVTADFNISANHSSQYVYTFLTKSAFPELPTYSLNNHLFSFITNILTLE